MKRTDQIEDQVRKFEVATTAGKDKAILESLLAAQRQSQCRTSTFGRVAVKVVIVSIAAGIMILSAIWLPSMLEKHKVSRPADSGEMAEARHPLPAETINMMLLNMAYRDGGMEAVEKSLEQTEKQVAPTPQEPVTIDQLLCESDGC